MWQKNLLGRVKKNCPMWKFLEKEITSSYPMYNSAGVDFQGKKNVSSNLGISDALYNRN